MKICSKSISSDHLKDDLDGIKILVLQENEDPPQAFDLRGNNNKHLKEQMKTMLVRMSGMSWGGHITREDVKVPAADFSKAFKLVQSITTRGRTADVSVWLHPIVPLNAMVKAITSDGDEILLIDFGEEGASTSLPNVRGVQP